VNQVLGNSALVKAKQRGYRLAGALGGFGVAGAAGMILSKTLTANTLNPFHS
jgi:hypothetical protein